MCGIVGFLSKQPNRWSLDGAVDSLRHRGPERSRQWRRADGTVAFGHTRLCIIDPDPRADQPFHYLDRYVLLYNGELYNYVEIRETLRSEGFPFTTSSDTEVVAAAWAAWGPACLERFDGAFAFALWDEQEQTLYAARDLFGEKPFFFCFTTDGDLAFASEMKALWQLGIERRANDALAFNFLTIGYTSNPFDATETFFEEIQRLPAGSWLTLRHGDAQAEVERYGRIDVAEQAPASDDEAVARFRSLLSESVRRRLRSDVPVGTSLSGGLDSSAVAALCLQAGGAHYTHRAFTAIFPGFEKNEQELSQRVARHLGMTQELVEIGDNEVPQLMDRVMYHQEEPVGSASALAQFRVFEAARAAGVTVLLDGQGADELLAGYDKYFRWWWQELYAQRRLKASGELQSARALGIDLPFGKAAKLAALFPQFAASLVEGRKARRAAQAPDLNPEWARLQRPHFYYMLPPQPSLNAVLHYNTFTNGLEELLRLADRNSMAHGLEVRLPFVSAELATYLFSLPGAFKIRNGRTKWLLREAMKDLLPAEVVTQVRKTGFEPPQARWMALPEVQERIRAAKEKLVGAGVLNAAVVQQKIKPHTAYAAEGRDWKYWTLSYLY